MPASRGDSCIGHFRVNVYNLWTPWEWKAEGRLTKGACKSKRHLEVYLRHGMPYLYKESTTIIFVIGSINPSFVQLSIFFSIWFSSIHPYIISLYLCTGIRSSKLGEIFAPLRISPNRMSASPQGMPWRGPLYCGDGKGFSMHPDLDLAHKQPRNLELLTSFTTKAWIYPLETGVKSTSKCESP